MWFIVDTFNDQMLSIVTTEEGNTMFFDTRGKAFAFGTENCQSFVVCCR